jgi:hypothetical protein
MKRVFTDAQRRAASERMKKISTERWAKVREESAQAMTAELDTPVPEQQVRAPEVQAIIDSMDEGRRAKLAAVQARTLQTLAQTKEGREALERLEARHQPESPVESKPKPPREAEEPPATVIAPMKFPFRLTGSISGLMISELGPCQCGEAKLKWHPICLKVKVRG